MLNKGEIKTIGIMRTSALGDIVWTIPMIRRLQLKYTNAKITLFVDHIFAPLLEGIDGIDIVNIKKPKSLSDYFSLRSILKKYNFDIFICAQANLRINILYKMINANRKIGFDSKRGRDGHKFFVDESIPFKKEHSLEAFLGFTDYLEANSKEIRFDLPIGEQDFNWARQTINTENYIVIHPKASSEQRTWALDRYVKVINSLSCEYKVILTGAPNDCEFNEKISSNCEVSPLNLAGKSSLKQLAAILKNAKLVIAPDSGPIHLAQAMGATTLGLFAALPPEYTGPYGQAENCINAYPEVVKKYLGKDVNDIEWRTRVREDGIMDLITVDQVLDKAKSLLSL
jgi:heptosyltransferase I